MFKIIKYEDIDKNRENKDCVLIDVRSPFEYNLETIPNAINIPIFNDEERKLIGTIYTQESVEKAKKLGIELASKKLPNIYDEISNLGEKHDKLILFCARGGYRSSSLVSLFNSIGINTYKLDCGYKGYRRYINENLPKLVKEIKFIVLYGNTGTGKTDILKALKNEGMDILDLEGCANHRGSLLGSIGLGKQNTQRMFESLIYESLIDRKTNIVFVEGESRRIGKDIIPEYLYQAMNNGINFKIHASMEVRINNILKDYVHDNDDELIASLNLLRKHISNKNIDKSIELIYNHEYRKVIKELMVKYYDPLYENRNRSYSHIFINEGVKATAKNICGTVVRNCNL